MPNNIQFKSNGSLGKLSTTEVGGIHTLNVAVVSGGGGGSGLTNAELRATPVPVRSSIPVVTSVTIVSLQTNATGTTWVTFGSQTCNALDIVNNTGTTLDYRRGGAGNSIPIPSGSSRMVIGITNANSIDIRRHDTSNTQVTVTAEAITV
jgi:hypothetical protein